MRHYSTAAVQSTACHVARLLLGSKQLVRVCVAGGTPEMTRATVTLIAMLLTRESSSHEDVFHATRAACRVAAFEVGRRKLDPSLKPTCFQQCFQHLNLRVCSLLSI